MVTLRLQDRTSVIFISFSVGRKHHVCIGKRSIMKEREPVFLMINIIYVKNWGQLVNYKPELNTNIVSPIIQNGALPIRGGRENGLQRPTL